MREVERVAVTEACTNPTGRRDIRPTFSAHEGQCAGFDSPSHTAAQHRAHETVHSTQHITMCRSVTTRAGKGHSTSRVDPESAARQGRQAGAYVVVDGDDESAVGAQFRDVRDLRRAA